MYELVHDLRLALRAFARKPFFTAIAVATLALGIGASTLIFSLVHGIAWQPLEFDEPERIVRVRADGYFSKEMFDWLQAEAGSYESLAVYLERGYVARGDAGSPGAEVVSGPQVSAGFFEVLRSSAERGRTFRPGDDRRGSEAVMLTHDYWQRRFGGDAAVLGSEIVLTGTRRTVVGVLPEGASVIQDDAQVVVPLIMERDESDYSAFHHLTVIGRLRDGVAVANAESELRTLMGRWRQRKAYDESWGREARVVTLRESLVGESRPGLVLLLGSVALLLVVACANVANMFLGRALARQHEAAVRGALGATPGRLVRHYLTESTVLALVAGTLGFALALLGLGPLLATMPPDTPRLLEVQLSLPVFLFALLAALVTGCAVGLLPAWQARRADLRAGSRGATGSRGRRRWRSSLIVAETAMGVVLLVGAAVLVLSFREIMSIEPGIEADEMYLLQLGRERGAINTVAEADVYYERIEEAISGVAGVESVAQVFRLPFLRSLAVWSDELYPLEHPPEGGTPAPAAHWRPVDPEYFSTAGIPLHRGRLFTSADRRDGAHVAILTESTARALFGDEDAIGQRVQIPWEEREEGFEVVGVVGDVRLDGLRQAPPRIVYRPFDQAMLALGRIDALWRHFVLRTSLGIEQLRRPLQAAIGAIEANTPVSTFVPVRGEIDGALAATRAVTLALALFAATALVLAAVGLYGVMSYSVEERTREMGIRLALGATAARLVARVVGEACRVTLVGLAVGLALAALAARFFAHLVFEISPLEPSVLVGVSLGLFAVAALAGYLPARRAGAVDPIRVLKDE